MNNLEKTIRGLEECSGDAYCNNCPYFEKPEYCSQDEMMRDALKWLKIFIDINNIKINNFDDTSDEISQKIKENVNKCTTELYNKWRENSEKEYKEACARAQAKINELQLKIKKLSNKNIDLTKLPPPNKQPPINFNCCWNYSNKRKKK